MNRVLHRRPSELAFRWTDADLKAFPELAVARREWDAWRAKNTPTDPQVVRKLLVDLWVDYLVSRHYGADLSTDDPTLSGLNECIGGPILSTDEYLDEVMPLAEYMMSSDRDVEVIGRAFLAFVLTGHV